MRLGVRILGRCEPDQRRVSNGLAVVARLVGAVCWLWIAPAACLAPAAFAQGGPALPSGDEALKKEQEALFQRILREPNNLDVTFRHAEVSTALGDYEAAIGSLERMLFFNPNLPRVMLELGVLYFRLGSYEMARTYFTKAIAAPDTPPEVRVKVDAFLAEIEKRLNPNLTIGYFQTGARYQTNANAGPAGSLVRVFGFDATLSRQFEKAPDWNWFAQSVVRNIYDFGNQRGDTWETTAAGYLSRQRQFSRLDTDLADVNTGPRLALFPESLNGWSARPYVGVTGVRLGDSNYLSAQTAGGSITWAPTPGWSFELGLERSRRAFHDTDDYPTADRQSGLVNTGYLIAGGPLLFGWTWSGRAAISDNDARFEAQSYRQTGGELSLAYTFYMDLFGAERRMTISPFAGILRAKYKDPDILVDPDMERRDLERRVGLSMEAQFDKRFGLGVRLQYSKTDSNIPNFDTSNFSIYAGPTVRF